ncbi:MAG: squalene synthase HpnC [Elusimicrobiota bacterium]|nr:squalene synthase HpnC [Elusimicrobiota bacterium]
MDTLKEYQATLADPADLAGAFRFCQDLADRHYENFPVASLLVPARLRKHVAVLYAFARIADDFSDEPEHEGFRRERLLDWRAQLAEVGQLPPRHPVFLALGETLRELDLPKEPFDDLLSAFLQDTEKSRYETFDEVLDYCRRSANPVGRIVLMIHGLRDPELFRWSDAVCTGLQLANFWQDVSVDLKKDRVYLPQEDFRAFGYSEADLRMGVCNERFRELMKFQVSRARSLFEQGKPLPSRLPWPLSLEIRLTWLGGMQVLKLIHKQDFDVLRSRPALGKSDWIPLFFRALLG